MKIYFIFFIFLLFPFSGITQPTNIFLFEIKLKQAINERDSVAVIANSDRLMNAIDAEPLKFRYFFNILKESRDFFFYTNNWPEFVNVSKFMIRGAYQFIGILSKEYIITLTDYMVACERQKMIDQRDSAQMELLTINEKLDKFKVLSMERSYDSLEEYYMAISFQMIVADTLDFLFKPLLQKAKELSPNLSVHDLIGKVVFYSDFATKLNNADTSKIRLLAGFLFETLNVSKKRVKEADAIDFRMASYKLSFYFHDQLFPSRTLKDTYTVSNKLLLDSKEIFGDSSINYAYALNDMGMFFMQFFDAGGSPYLDSAIEYFERSIALKKRLKDTANMEYIKSLNNLAEAYDNTFQFGKEAILLKAVLKIKIQLFGQQDEQVARSFARLAVVLEELGNYSEAEETALHAIALFNGYQTINMDKTGLLNYVLPYTVMATIRVHFKDYMHALLYYDTAQSRVYDFKSDETTQMTMLASIYHDIGFAVYQSYIERRDDSLLGLAETFFKESLALKARLGLNNTLTYNITQRFLADILFDKKELEKSIENLKEILAFRQRIFNKKQSGFISSVEISIGNCYIQMRQYDSSEKYIRDAYEIDKEISNSNSPLIGLIEIYTVSGQYDKILSYTEQFLSYLETSFRQGLYLSENQKEISYSQIQHLFDILYSLTNRYWRNDPSKLLRVFKIRQSYKSLILRSAQFRNNQISQLNDPATNKLFSQYTNIKNKITQIIEYNSLTGSKYNNYDSLLLLSGTIEKRLIKKLGVIQELASADKRVEKINAQMGNGQRIIDFIEFNDVFDSTENKKMISAFVLSRESAFPKFFYLCREKQILQLQDTHLREPNSFTNQFYLGKTENKSQISEGGNIALFNLLIKPLSQELISAKIIYFIPEGYLNGISFESILLPDRTFLFTKYDIHYLYNIFSLINKSSRKNRSTHLVIFGNINYNKAEGENARPDSSQILKGWAALTGAKAECNMIAKLMKRAGISTTYYQEEHATEESFRSLSQKSFDYLHIATHGYYKNITNTLNKIENDHDPDNRSLNDMMLDNGLVFSGANLSVSSKNPAKDGLVSALDIANMQLNNVRLVVLSSCESGLGENASLEGVMGFQRALKLAGIDNLIVSLWAVSDPSTAEFMELFYTALAVNGSPFKSLHTAREKLQQKYPYEPYLWGAFILVE